MRSKPLVVAALLSAVVGCRTATLRGTAPLGYRPRGTAVSVPVQPPRKAPAARPAPAKPASAKGSVVYGARVPRAAIPEPSAPPAPRVPVAVQPQPPPVQPSDALEARRKRLKSLLEMQMIDQAEYERRLKGLQ